MRDRHPSQFEAKLHVSHNLIFKLCFGGLKSPSRHAPPAHGAPCVVLTFHPVPALTLGSKQHPNVSVLGQFRGQPLLWRALKNLPEPRFKPPQPSRERCWHGALQSTDTQPHFHSGEELSVQFCQAILFIFHHGKQQGRGWQGQEF